MKNSLQDQLLKSGLVDEKKLKQHQRAKKKQAKQHGKGEQPVDEIKLAAQQARAERAEQDRQRNRELQEQARHKAVAAQIVQLIEVHRIDRSGGNVAYQFADGKKIKKLYVPALLQSQLERGLIGIVRLADDYELVPAVIAGKIRERNPAAVVVLRERSAQTVDEDDPYADYPIPDDLMW